jgi:glycosyltransferase involved in cell wall biosynthesis
LPRRPTSPCRLGALLASRAVPGDAEVLLLDHAETGGGGQRFALRLATELRAQGRPVRVGCMPDTSLAGWCREAGIDLVTAAYPRPSARNARGVAVAVRTTRRLLEGMPPGSLVIGNHTRVHAYLYLASRRMETPPIVSIAHAQEAAHQAVARYIYRRFGALVVIGANALREYEARLSGIRVTKINNFLAAADFERARQERVLSPAHEDPTVGVMARLIPEKGVAELIEELADPTASTAWRNLVIAGGSQDPTYAARVEQVIAQLGLTERVRLIGETDDVPGFLGSIDTLIVPSTGKEVQPTAIIEALAYGVPVVVREPLYSPDFEGLPVAAYGEVAELAEALRAPRPAAAPMDVLIGRFGPEQAIAGIDAAAHPARVRS